MQILTHYKMWLAALALAILVSCSPAQPSSDVQKFTGNTMGTYYVVKFVHDSNIDKVQLQQQVDTDLELINELMSTYRPQSELMRFNAYQGNEAFALSEPTRTVIQEAIRIGKQTKGVLDVTVGPLVELWGFGAQGRIETAPEQLEIDAVKPYIGIDKLQLTAAGLSKSVPELAVDLSTIAKGYAVDRVAEILEHAGVENYLIEIGGEMRLKGSKTDQPWRIAIEKPEATGRAVQRVITPGDMGVATSGDYRNYFEQDGVRFSHLINPHTGQPIQNRIVSTTVFHPSCMTADAYATALNIMQDEQQALAFANQHQIAVLMVVKTDDGYQELASEKFKPYLTE
jgi:FAD:protein FMN transferase